jgi:peroxiredoxin
MSLSRELAELYAREQQEFSSETASAMARALRELRAAGLTPVGTGDIVADFTLSHIMGHEVSFGALVARGPVVLSFFRGGWCPYCNLELRALKEALANICMRGATLVLISPETADSSLDTCKRRNLEYGVLCNAGLEVLNDEHNRVARGLGLVYRVPDCLRWTYLRMGIDLHRYNGDDSWELPLPATLVIDAARRIHVAFVDIDYTKRLEPGRILEALDALRGPG